MVRAKRKGEKVASSIIILSPFVCMRILLTREKVVCFVKEDVWLHDGSDGMHASLSKLGSEVDDNSFRRK